MADIIDLKFVTDTTGLDKAVTKSRSLEKRIIKLAKEVATGRITSDQYTKAVKKSASELQKLSGMGIRARKSVYDYSASVYQAATASNKAAASTDNYSGSLNQLSTSSIGATSSLGMLSRQAHQTKNKMNANGMAMQQLGYQTGDFIVQVQSGTNAWVAAGQQLTQLTGVLGMMNPAWIGIGAALGIVVPLVTAVGAAFSRSKSSADDLTTTLDELENAYSKIESINDTLEVQLVGTWAAASEGADNYLRKLREVTQESARAAGEDVLTRDAGILAQFKADLLGGDDTSGIVSQMDESIEDLLAARDRLFKQYNEITMGGAAGDKLRIKKLREISPEARSLLNAANALAQERQEFLNVFAKGTTTEESVIRILALREKYEKSGGDAMLKRIDGIITELKLEGEITAYRKKLADDQEATTKNQLDHIDELLKAGIDAANAQTKSDNLKTKNQLDNVDALLKAGIAAADAQTKADDLKTKNQLAHVDDLLKAGIKAADEEIKADNQKTADQLENIDDLLKAGTEAHEARLQMIQDEAKELNYFNNIMLAWQNQIGKGQKERDKEGPKGAKTSLQKLDEEIDKMQIQHNEKVASIGLTREELYFQEAKFQLIQKIGTAESKRHMAKIEAAAKEDAANRNQLETLQRIKDRNNEIAQSIGESFGSAMTSIVDGTKSVKDAFKDMANEIIKELYRIFVVKQITGMIANVISPGAGDSYMLARGGVLNNGQVVPYANGGVVGSPTTFPMAGGRTGLMGEAGPEAIMPLKRGKNGKLGVQAEGGSGDVIIHQNFNFTANGDESVKKIIAQQAPAIANMTKKQILDDRRRGGQMKQAFG